LTGLGTYLLTNFFFFFGAIGGKGFFSGDLTTSITYGIETSSVFGYEV